MRFYCEFCNILRQEIRHDVQLTCTLCKLDVANLKQQMITYTFRRVFIIYDRKVGTYNKMKIRDEKLNFGHVVVYF